MAKKTVSFSLEEDLIKMIIDVKKEKKLSSKSAALERILLSKQNDREYIKNIVFEILDEKGNNINSNINTSIDTQKTIDEVEKSINDSYSNMPD